MNKPTNPRGEPNWPKWKTADCGVRVRHVRTGRTGTFIRVGNPGGNAHAIVDWDDVGFGVNRGRVIAPAYDLEEIA